MKALNWITNRHVLSALLAAPILFSSALASAEEAAAPATEPVAPYTLSFNLGLYSNYMFRGVALSDGPAIQGGIDFAHSTGFYLGTWFSTIDQYASFGNKNEIDIYGGYAHTFENGLGVNLMGNYYWYPDGEEQGIPDTMDTFEVSAAVSYKFLTYTYYNVLTDYYGAADTKNADYHELKVNQKLPIGGLNFMAKVGYQNTRNLTGDQGDYAIGLNRDFTLPGSTKPIEGFNAGAVFTDTFSVEDESFYKANGRDTNEKKLTFYVKRTW